MISEQELEAGKACNFDLTEHIQKGGTLHSCWSDCDNKKLVAFVATSVHSDCVVSIDHMYVAPAHRRQRVATKLVAMTIEHFDGYALKATCPASLRNIFEDNGFSVLGWTMPRETGKFILLREGV